MWRLHQEQNKSEEMTAVTHLWWMSCAGRCELDPRARRRHIMKYEIATAPMRKLMHWYRMCITRLLYFICGEFYLETIHLHAKWIITRPFDARRIQLKCQPAAVAALLLFCHRSCFCIRSEAPSRFIVSSECFCSEQSNHPPVTTILNANLILNSVYLNYLH